MYFLVSSLSIFYYSIDHFLCMGLSCFLCIIILLLYWPFSLYETFLFHFYHYYIILLTTFSVWNFLVPYLSLFCYSIGHFLCMKPSCFLFIIILSFYWPLSLYGTGKVLTSSEDEHFRLTASPYRLPQLSKNACGQRRSTSRTKRGQR